MHLLLTRRRQCRRRQVQCTRQRGGCAPNRAVAGRAPDARADGGFARRHTKESILKISLRSQRDGWRQVGPESTWEAMESLCKRCGKPLGGIDFELLKGQMIKWRETKVESLSVTPIKFYLTHGLTHARPQPIMAWIEYYGTPEAVVL